jgi:hypothetical protein
MRRRYLAALAGVSLTAATGASAGVFTDDLTPCAVNATNTADRIALSKFVFLAMAASPDIASMVSATPAERAKINQAAAGLFERIIFQDCRAQFVAAVRNEGGDAFKAPFGALGQVATTEIMNSPAADAAMGAWAKSWATPEKFEPLMKEAGISRPASAPPK